MKIRLLASASVLLALSLPGAFAQSTNAVPAKPAPPVIKFVIKPDHANGVYALNEKVTWTVDTAGDRTGLTAMPYTVKEDGATEIAHGTVDLSTGPATITASLGVPGILLTEVQSAQAKRLALGGAVVAPDKIAPSAPAPDDFDAFWQSKLKELAAVPVHPALEKVDVSALPNGAGLEYDKVTLDNIRGTHVQGQLARPAREGKFPAMLIVQYAGVYPLDKNWVLNEAKAGWLVLNISAHDQPIDQPPDFYKNLAATTLKNYTGIGCEDRETSYFLRMFLGDARAVDYLTSRPDWDGKTLLVTGTSQGGLQSFVTGALRADKVTAVAVNVPAGTDVYAPLAKPPRGIPWPYWLQDWNLKGHDAKKVQATAGYFDAINFAARVHCPTLVSVGLIDETARPTGVIAAYNQLKGPKELVILPSSDHHGTGNAQAHYGERAAAWKKALLAGQPLPVAPRP